jgi:uncharacterized protein YhbP (UPF0306 family)
LHLIRICDAKIKIMKTALELTEQYLTDCFTMQVATVNNDQPWVSTVHFVSDVQHNLYWASLPNRRHSQEIAKHHKAACAIVVQNMIGKPVIGLQIEGTAEMLNTPLDNREIVEKYADTFKRDLQWVDDFVAGRTEHRLYKLVPSAIHLFDEVNFPGGQRQRIL